MTNTYIALESVSFTLPDGTPLFSSLTETFDTRPTGLVGRNGVGKSILSQILAGHIAPSDGRCVRSGRAFYLAQQIPYRTVTTVAELAGVQGIINALERIEMGSVSAADFDIVGQHWDVRQQLQLQLERCGLPHLAASTPVKLLSGGEAMRVSLIGAWLSEADFLILDEPSNHLDRSSRLALMAQLQRWSGGLLVVSHDRELLGAMQRIVELSPAGLSSYGGGYPFYAQQKSHELQNSLQQLERRKHERQRAQKALQDRKEQLDKRQSRGQRQGRDANQAKILLGGQKQRSEKSAGKLSQLHLLTQQRLDQRVREAAAEVEENMPIVVHSPPMNSHSQRIIAELNDLQLPFSSLVSSPLNLKITSRQRIAVTGGNGCGKSTLLKVMAGQLSPRSGACRVTAEYAWLDQHVASLDPQRSVLEQILDVNRTAGEADLRMRLAQLGLDAQKITFASGALSGGERLKAALACVLYADSVPQLLLLDEPSNHLDLPSIQALEAMLCAYQSALLIVSHDDVFLRNLNITERLAADDDGWQYLPW